MKEEEKKATNQMRSTAEGRRATPPVVAIFTAVRGQKQHRRLDGTAASSGFLTPLFLRKLLPAKAKRYLRPAVLPLSGIPSVLP